jgi:hypothetical protein
MPTVVSGSLRAEDFALSRTTSTLTEARFEPGRVVATGHDSAMPLLRVHGPVEECVLEPLRADPSVESVTPIRGSGEDRLFAASWTPRVELVAGMLTGNEATLVDAVGQAARWEFEILYAERSGLSQTQEFAGGHGIALDIDSIRDLDGVDAGEYALTIGQHEALSEAQRLGYFDVLRGVSLEDLATELGVTHQAASERLRRAMGSLVDHTLTGGKAAENGGTLDAPTERPRP